ncbi:MAG TPA: ABC transporter permease [Thermoanaerobaculia bacterium]|jgi:ABC-type polysaccharide/polyol phosphate export permease|nr:ABC transporter permease [Thermoanaerobaculia bacterium]
MSDAAQHPLVEITRARLLEFWRQPEALFWVFGFPVIMAVVLGLAFRNKPPEEVPVGVLGDGPAAAGLVAVLDASPVLTAKRMASADAARALRTAKVELLVTPRNDGAAEASVAAPAVPAVTFRFDPQRAEARTARLAAADALERAAGRRDPVPVGEEEVHERGQRYVDFLIPGLIGLNLMSSALWGFSFALVQMRAGKLLRRFAATPMRRADFLIGLMGSRLIFLAVQVAFLLVFGWLAFHVEVHGSLLSIAVIGAIGTCAFTAIAMLAASRAKTLEGVSGITNLIMIPMWLLSGTFFSYERFPAVLQPIIKALPLTAFNDALRLVINDGASLPATWLQLLILALWAVLPFAAALKLFRWQ